MSKSTLGKVGLIGIGLLIVGLIIYQIPSINSRLNWRLDIARTYLRNVINPVGQMPTPLPQPVAAVTSFPTQTPTELPTLEFNPTATAGPTPTQTAIPTALPELVNLGAPSWEKQTPNNCGPATLAMYLHMYNWEGSQEDISDLLKPLTADRNVNVEELVYFVRTQAGWLSAEYRVGGDIELMKKFLAAGLPVVIEEGELLDGQYWPNDDQWAGHYLLLTGYDDASQSFITQDSFRSSDRSVSYQSVMENWQAFNYVYLLVFHSDQLELVKSILGEDWDVDTNRQKALELARTEINKDPEDAFAWFNLGSNQVYFENYSEAGQAYDTARQIGLPQRMMRYQFGPYFAYFFSGRNDDLLALTEYALQRTPNSEESLLWRGWGKYRAGQTSEAIQDFQEALEMNPFYQDAQYALEFVGTNP